MQAGSSQTAPPPRRLEASQRRAKILDAALDLFAERGYDSVSMGEIAAGAGITKPVLYDHFTSKQGLYVALVEREATLLSAALLSSFDPGAPLEERLGALASSAIGFARGRPASSRLLLQMPGDAHAVRDVHAQVRTRGREATAAAILADPAFEASPGLSRKASAELLGDLHTAVLERLVRWAIEHPGTSARALSDLFVDVLWSGLGRD